MVREHHTRALSRRQAAALALAGALAFPAAAHPQSGGSRLTTYGSDVDTLVQVEVAPDGHVLHVETDPSLAPAIAKPLAEGVARWTFRPPTFRGKPATIRAPLRVALRLLPVKAGGYALQVQLAYPDQVDMKQLPSMRFSRPPSNTSLLYSISVGTDGRMTGELVQPKDRQARKMDPDIRYAIEHTPPRPRWVDGAPIACRFAFLWVFTYAHDTTVTADGTAARKALEDSFPDICPAAVPAKGVAGTLL